jgi:hypothetical protein
VSDVQVRPHSSTSISLRNRVQRVPTALRSALVAVHEAMPRTTPLYRVEAWVGVHSRLLVGLCQFVTALGLATFPWLHLQGEVPVGWPVWLAAVGFHAVWLAIYPTRNVLLPVATLALVLGLCAIQVLAVYTYIVMGYPQMDYYMLASWIAAASDHFNQAPPTMWYYDPPASYLGTYFDPIVPAINALAHLTDSPFRLLGFQTMAILSAAVATWWITIRHHTLAPVQALLPAALLLHPTLALTLQADYHTSGIGITPLLIGTYLFFVQRRAPAFAALLLGTLTKISYWPTWMMFGFVHATRREWRWAAAYAATGIGALGLHQVLEAGHPGVGLSIFFPGFGSTPLEVVHTAIFSPSLWLTPVSDVSRWAFFGHLLLPLGFGALLFPPAVVPLLPLVVFSLLDASGFRRTVDDVYAIEFLGFLAAAALLGLQRSGASVRVLATAALVVGVMATFTNPERWTQWNATLARTALVSAGYSDIVNFTSCAIDDQPVLTTGVNWSSYVRAKIASVWVDPGGMTLPDSQWDRFQTVVYHKSPAVAGSLTNFPNVKGWDVAQYTRLLNRLPFTVTVGGTWQYVGGERLAACAARFGLRTDANRLAHQ